MSIRTLRLDDRVYQYLLSASLREPELLRRLRAETAALPQASMQIAPEQGQFMALLLRLMGAVRGIEVGVFTGYSALCMARALPPEGRIVACDVSEEWTAVARRYWREAGVADRIDLRIGPALTTLDGLLEAGAGGTFNFAFIDADKENYSAYFERCLQLLEPGGVIMVDNVLWDGRVADPDNRESDTVAIRDFNRRLLRDGRVELSMLPVGDGLTLARKRG